MASASSSPPLDIPFIVRDRRRKGFFTIDNLLVDFFGALLGPYGLVVYMALARFANQESACWPSLTTIAQRTGMSRRQVIREIDKLQALHLIAVEPQFDSTTGEHKANRYILLDVTPSDSQSLPSDSQSLGGSDSQSPPSDPQSPKQNIENKTQHRNQTQRTTRARDDQGSNNNSGVTQAVVVAETSAFSSLESETLSKRTTQTDTDNACSSVLVVLPPSSDAPPSPT